MKSLQAVLTGITVVVGAMTVMAVVDGGFDLITPFIGPVLAGSWQGQFNVDFASYLVLSGIWMAWRSGFTSGGIALGVLAPPLGILFFAPYLLYLIGRHSGDPRRLLLGVHA